VDDDGAIVRDVRHRFTEGVERPVQAPLDRLHCALACRTDIDDERRIGAGHAVGGGLRAQAIRRDNHR